MPGSDGSDGSFLAAFKLPPGRHGLPRQYVAENQRWRLVGAAVELLTEDGYRLLTSHRVARRACVSTQTFYVHFENVEGCFHAAFEVAMRNLEHAVHRGCDQSGDPREQVAGAIRETLALLDREPALRRLFSLEIRAAIPTLMAAFAQLVDPLAAMLQSAGGDGMGLITPAPIRSRLLVEATLGVLAKTPAHDRLASSKLADQLTSLICCLPRECG